MDPAIVAAERALRGIFVEGKQARDCLSDIDAAGPAFLGVLSAFFRNVMEGPFTGHEDVTQVRNYLHELRRLFPAELAALQPEPMAVFVLDQIGPGALPPGQSRFPLSDGVIYQMRLIAEYAAKHEGIMGTKLDTWIRGACARYLMNDY